MPKKPSAKRIKAFSTRLIQERAKEIKTKKGKKTPEIGNGGKQKTVEVKSNPPQPRRDKRGRFKAQKQVKIKSSKRFQRFLKNYNDLVERGELDKIKEIERLKEWFGVRGAPNLRALRSNKAREEFNAQVTEFNKKYRRWGRAGVAELAEKQQELKSKRGESYTQRVLAEQEIKPEKDINKFYQEALKTTQQYYKMIDLFALDSFEKLREQLNIGSPVVEKIANSKMTVEQANKYFDDFLNAVNFLPREAQKYATEDELMQAIIELRSLAGAGNFQSVLTQYLQAPDDDRDHLLQVAGYHAQAVNKGATNKDFSDFYNDILKYGKTDIYNQKTWSELL